jgi:Flp pilus assembly protein CpaB
MNRRGRAAVFGLLALAAAGVAAAIADSYGSRVARSFGPLRPVVVARGPLPAGKPIGPSALESILEVRRVPTRFIPPGALSQPEGALGLAPRANVPAGAYVTASILRSPRQRRRAPGPGLAPGRRPVAISVSGAAGLAGTMPRGGGSRVDVVVTTEPTGAGTGRTYIAAARVPLLGLESAGQGLGPTATATATLGLTRRQALELISAQSFARQVTLLASAPP